jgi:hypothetical protein
MYKLTGTSNVRSEVTITKDHFTTFASEMTLVYEIPWPSLYNMFNKKKKDKGRL